MTDMIGGETPTLGIFWVARAKDGEARLLASGCSLDEAEPYGDCLTYGPGHYDIWTQWRNDRNADKTLRAIVRAYEYEDWPRGRIIVDRERDLFILYADRKLMTPGTLARIRAHFHLPEKRTSVEGDFHYQSRGLLCR